MSSKQHPCPSCGHIKYFEGLCYNCRIEEKIENILALSDAELSAKVKEIIENIEDDRYSNDLFLEIFSLRRFNTTEIAKAAAEKEIYEPAALFVDASTEIRDILIHKIKSTDDSSIVADLLLCLAGIGDQAVVDLFAELEKNPLPWREKLYVGPAYYALHAGWTIDKGGNKYPVVFDDCYKLEKSDRKDNAVTIGKTTEEKCPYCSCPMTDVFTLNGNDKRLESFNIDGTLRINLCPNCITVNDKMFSRFSPDGSVENLPLDDNLDENYIPEEDLIAMNQNTFVLSEKQVSPYYGTFFETTNTVGGFANWVQDFEHPECPDCGKRMKYIAQVQWDTILDSREGNLFIEICPDCNISCAFHQQT